MRYEWLKEVLSRKVGEYARRDCPVVKASETVALAARKMRERGLGAAIVEFEDGSLGIVTERDVLERVVAEGKDPSSVRVGDIASKPLVTIREDASVGDAIIKMVEGGFRRLGVVDSNGRLVGLLTISRALGGKRDHVALLPEPEGYICPFCGEVFENKEELSKHIDLVHIGIGLLQGNIKRWEPEALSL